jgi:hypothetical protein
MANYVPDDALDLEIEAEVALRTTAEDQSLLRSFFAAAKLRI